MEDHPLESQDLDFGNTSPSTLRKEMHELVDYAEYVYDYAALLLDESLPEALHQSVEAIFESAREIIAMYTEALECEPPDDLEKRAGNIFAEMEMLHEILMTFCEDFEDYFPYITQKPQLRTFLIPDFESQEDIISETIVIHQYSSSMIH